MPGPGPQGGVTRLDPEETGGLGPLEVRHPPGTFPPSPASRITLRAVGAHQDQLQGQGVDWGCGVGLLAIAAARIPAVDGVTGLDLQPENVAAARANATLNRVEDHARFLVADSFAPVTDEGRARLEELRGRVHFLVANPPASDSADGFDFRRRLLRDAAPYLRPGALVLLQALSVYGPERAQALADEPGGFDYDGVALRSSVVPLDYARASIRRQHAVYLRAEAQGRRRYRFLADPSGREVITATEAARRVRGGARVYGRWQVHRFRKAFPGR